MEQFVARQPIFDRNLNVFAYELLFRSRLVNFFDFNDGDQASRQVIANSFLVFGIERMTVGSKAFINFTRGLLVDGYALALPPEWVVVEILEGILPDPEVLAACRELKAKGFTLALDDFVYDPVYEPLLDLADIVKVDFLISPEKERARLAKLLEKRGVTLLAEKIETRAEFEQALEMGFSLFQGYFFQKPVTLSQKDIPSLKLNNLRILSEVNAAELDFDGLAEIIGTDLSMSFKLLRYVNSAFFGYHSKIESIKHALAMMGENEVKKWVSLLSLAGLADDKPAELVTSSLIRAKFCEKAAPLIGYGGRDSELFLMGLFSLLHAIIDQPLDTVLEGIPLAEDLKDALLGRKPPGPLRLLLAVVQAWEKGDWVILGKIAQKLRLKENDLPEIYFEAVSFPRTVLSLAGGSGEAP
ncbi:MAG: HDOD domain-containing protein [Pseudomonadota bacterium]